MRQKRRAQCRARGASFPPSLPLWLLQDAPGWPRDTLAAAALGPSQVTLPHRPSARLCPSAATPAVPNPVHVGDLPCPLGGGSRGGSHPSGTSPRAAAKACSDEFHGRRGTPTSSRAGGAAVLRAGKAKAAHKEKTLSRLVTPPLNVSTTSTLAHQ